MMGLSPMIIIHHLGIKKGTHPIEQSLRVFRLELVTQIEVEVNKLIEAGFVREVKYPLWISNIVLVKKKNGQICIRIDFRDSTKACPKDDFPMPIIERSWLMLQLGINLCHSWMGLLDTIKLECLQNMKNTLHFKLQKGFIVTK